MFCFSPFPCCPHSQTPPGHRHLNSLARLGPVLLPESFGPLSTSNLARFGSGSPCTAWVPPAGPLLVQSHTHHAGSAGEGLAAWEWGGGPMPPHWLLHPKAGPASILSEQHFKVAYKIIQNIFTRRTNKSPDNKTQQSRSPIIPIGA